MEQKGTNSDPCSSWSPIGHPFLWTLKQWMVDFIVCSLPSLNSFGALPPPPKKYNFGNHIYVYTSKCTI